MKIERKVSNQACAKLLGVGRPTITAVRKMLGIAGESRKVFPSAIAKFLKDHQDFQIADSRDMVKFKQRYPKFQLPV